MARMKFRLSTMALVASLCIIAHGANAADSTESKPEWLLAAPREIAFKAKFDGTVQRYVETLPANFVESKPHDLLVALHGWGGDRWQYVNAVSQLVYGTRDAASKHAMILISPDYRGSASWMNRAAESDVIQIIKAERKRHKVDKIFLTGNSMGGTSALAFTVLHPELIDGLCSVIGCANLFDLHGGLGNSLVESFGGRKDQILMEYKKRSAEYWPEKFTMPVSFVTGGKDDTIPPASIYRLVSVLQQTGAKVKLIDRPETAHDASREDTCAAIDFIVEAAHSAEQKLH